MNRRERSLPPVLSHTRRLLPRISHFSNFTADSENGGDGDAAVNRSWVYNDRITQEQSQRQQQSAEQSCQSRQLFPLADIIDKIELLPDVVDVGDGQGAIATDEDGSQGGRDSIFSDDDGINDVSDGAKRRSKVEGTLKDILNELAFGEAPTPTTLGEQKSQSIAPTNQTMIDEQERQFDAENLRMRRKLQEAALLEAMSAPGRCRRQLLAMSLARGPSHRGTAESSGIEGPSSGCMTQRSASLPPQPRTSSFGPTSFGKPGQRPVQSLSEFLSSKEKKATLTAERAFKDNKIKSHDNDTCISSVTVAELSEEDGSVIVNHNAKQRERKADKLLLDSPNSTAPSDAQAQLGQPCPAITGINASNDATTVDISTPTDYRSDVLYPMGTVDLDEETSELRQSPEHSQSSSPTSQQSLSGPTSEQELLGTVADSPVDTKLWRTATASPDNTPSGLCHMPSLLYYSIRNVPISNANLISADDVLKTKVESQNSSAPKSAASPSSPINNGPNDVSSPEVDRSLCNDITADEGEEWHDCKNSETCAETVSSDEDVELLSSKDGSKDDDSLPGKNSMTISTVDEKNKKKIMGSIHDVLMDSEHGRLYSHPNVNRASTPRTMILEQQGLSHHHRFARHRSIPSEPITIVPLNHVSSALVVNSGGGGGMNGHHSHGMVKSCSARDLVDLRALMDELTELRAWKVRAAESLEAHKGLKEVDVLRASMAEASEEVIRLRSEGEERRLEVESLKSRFKKEVLEWKTAAEQAVAESSKEIATLSICNKEMRSENERLSGNVDDLKNRLESMLHSAERERLLADEEARGLHMLLHADITRLESNLEEIKRSNDAKDKELMDLKEKFTASETLQNHKMETALRAREEEISSLKSELANMAKCTSTLQAKINATNLASEFMTSELQLVEAQLKEEIDAHAKKRLEAATCEKQMSITLRQLDSILKTVTNQVEDQDSVIQAKTVEINRLQEKLAADEDARQNLEAILHSKNEEVTQLKIEVVRISEDDFLVQAQLNEKIHSLNQELSAVQASHKAADLNLLELLEHSSDDVTHPLKDELENKAQQVLMLQQALVDEKDEAMVKLAHIQAELEHKISEMEKQVAIYKEQSDLLHEELAVLQHQLTLEQESKSKELAEAALTIQKMQSEIHSLIETGH
ncbi:hypothetical protein ACHAW5_007930, partial [Stephanodiscus triporus]